MVARTLAVALAGLTGHVVEVEAHLGGGLPTFAVVGLPDAALHEARDRVRAAVASCGLDFPSRRITVNLSPASLPKSGSGFDLAVAVAVLAAAGLPDGAAAAHRLHLGELGLDGRVHAVRGVLPAVLAAVRAGVQDVVVPSGNADEARLVHDARVTPVDHLAQVVRLYGGQAVEPPAPESPAPGPPPATAPPDPVDLADVVGQDEARLALEVAAAGSHHLFLLGPPGAGKTMLATRLPGLLPDLDDDAAVEVTAVSSLAGTLDASRGLVRRPPFEDPHHTATAAAIVGGGAGLPLPGAASRAHRGILFLDEAPEFAPRVLQSLRQPLESGELVIHRARGQARYPARFQLVLAANPCPCGKAVGKGLQCSCTPMERRRYLARLSGPLLDRIDLQVEVGPVSRAAVAVADHPEPTATVARRVAAARERQRSRLAGTPWATNAEVPGPWLRDQDVLPRRDRAILERALDTGALSLRGLDRVLRIAWTLADLAEADRPGSVELGTALTLRTRGRGNDG